MLLEFIGLRCSAETLKNKIEFYNIIKIEKKLAKVGLSRILDEARVLVCVKFLVTCKKSVEYVDNMSLK